MQVILHGSFGHFPLDQLLTFFSTFTHTGALDILCDDRVGRIFFEDGAVIHAESNSANGAQAVLDDMFVWPGGTFTFSAGAALPEGNARSTVDIQAVIQGGLARAAEWRSLMTLYPSEDVILRVVENPQAEAQISLTGEEFRILMKVGAQRTLRQLRSDLNRPAAELYPLVHRLESCGLIAREEPQENIQTLRNFDVPETGAEKTTIVPRTTRVSALTASQPAAAPAPPEPEPPPEPITEPQLPAPSESAAPGTELLVGSLTMANGSVFPLVDPSYEIGRDSKNDIAIHDASVSSQHARIVRDDHGFVIEDTQSRNGTFVNGEKIAAPRTLADADVVRLGKIVLTFNVARKVITREKTS